MLTKSLDEEEIIEREETHYACGCTTTRISHRRGPRPNPAHCHGHGGRVVKVIRIIEYPPHNDPAQG